MVLIPGQLDRGVRGRSTANWWVNLIWSTSNFSLPTCQPIGKQTGVESKVKLQLVGSLQRRRISGCCFTLLTCTERNTKYWWCKTIGLHKHSQANYWDIIMFFPLELTCGSTAQTFISHAPHELVVFAERIGVCFVIAEWSVEIVRDEGWQHVHVH